MRKVWREEVEPNALEVHLSLLREEGVSLEELFRVAQSFGGGVGFVVRDKEVTYTDLAPHTLPPRPPPGLGSRGGLEGGGFGLMVSLEGVRNLFSLI